MAGAGVALLPQPEVALPPLDLAGAAVDGEVVELLQPELLLPDEDDDEVLPPLEKDDLLLLARAGWPQRTRARARSRDRTGRANAGIPGASSVDLDPVGRQVQADPGPHQGRFGFGVGA